MPKVLVIEDQPFVRENITEMLETEGYEVVSAENGFIGSLWALEHIPDVVICDIMMPEANGYEVLETLRQNPSTASIPFIFLSAMANKPDIRAGMNLGADDYLTKPFTRIELLEAISARLDKQEKQLQQHNVYRDHLESSSASRLNGTTDTSLEGGNEIQEQFNKALPRLNLAILMLRNMQTGFQRNNCLEVFRETFLAEIKLLNQVNELRSLLPIENLKFLEEIKVL